MRRAPSWPFTRALASDSGTTRGGGYLGEKGPEAQAVTLLPRGVTGQGRSPELSGPRAYSFFCPRRDNRCEGVLSSAKRGNCKTTRLWSVTHHTENNSSGGASSLCRGEDRRRLRRASVTTLHPYMMLPWGRRPTVLQGQWRRGAACGGKRGSNGQASSPPLEKPPAQDGDPSAPVAALHRET